MSLNKILNFFLGKAKFQKIFEKLHIFSLYGMNIGTGSNIKDSGEIYVLKYINNYLRDLDNLVVFDVGANIGEYSKLVNKILKNTVFIYAFEPSINTFKNLKQNVEGIENINVYNIGFGDKTDKFTLYYNEVNSGLASLYKRNLEYLNITLNKQEEVQITTLDNFCTQNNIERINLLKLDTEGSELNILKGATDLLKNNKIDFIQFEFGGTNIDSRTFFKDFYYLLNDNYKIYRILKNGLHEINKYKETYEIFITTNYLAENRFIRKLRKCITLK